MECEKLSMILDALAHTLAKEFSQTGFIDQAQKMEIFKDLLPNFVEFKPLKDMRV